MDKETKVEKPAPTMMIGELASRSGVTERALRHYEKVGLMAPARTGSGQRVYGEKDVLRLQEIQLLKRAGFTLSAIRSMTKSKGPDARALLGTQLEVMQAEVVRLTRAIEATSLALRAVEAGAPVDLSSLCQLISQGEQTMSEEKWQKVWDKFYTEEEKAAWAEAKSAISSDALDDYNARWMAVIARAEKLKGGDPASDEAQEVAREWNALTGVLTSINPELSKSAGKLYENMDAWPKDGPPLPFSPELWPFMQKACTIAKEREASA